MKFISVYQFKIHTRIELTSLRGYLIYIYIIPQYRYMVNKQGLILREISTKKIAI